MQKQDSHRPAWRRGNISQSKKLRWWKTCVSLSTRVSTFWTQTFILLFSMLDFQLRWKAEHVSFLVSIKIIKKKNREEGSRGRGYMYSWFMLLYSRNQHNTVKQLFSNLKNKFKIFFKIIREKYVTLSHEKHLDISKSTLLRELDGRNSWPFPWLLSGARQIYLWSKWKRSQ